MMARSVLRRLMVLCALALVLAGAAGCGVDGLFGPRVESTAVRTVSFAASPNLIVDAESANGAIAARLVEGQTAVQVRITLRSRGTTLEEANARLARIVVRAEQEGDRIVLRYVAAEQDDDVRRSSGVAFDVTLPGAASVRAETSNGAIRVAGMRGPLDLVTSNGEIVVEQCAGAVKARTSNGQILIQGGEGALALRTSNGRIRMDGVAAVVDAETSNGEIAFSGRLLSGQHRMETSNGRIAVRVPTGASVRVVARTSNAAISSSLPLTGDVTGRTWDATQNPPAEATLTVETSNGAIDLAPLP